MSLESYSHALLFIVKETFIFSILLLHERAFARCNIHLESENKVRLESCFTIVHLWKGYEIDLLKQLTRLSNNRKL